MKEQETTRARREANKAFKPVEAEKTVTDYAKAQRSFHENRERLKAERLARDAKPKRRPE
jgi:hypothetical protein